MKKLFYPMLFLVLLFSANIANAQTNSGNITIELTAKTKVFKQNIGRNLILRIVKDSNVKHRDFGWIVEVFRQPRHRRSENLIYQNETGTTADASQVYAWHVASGEFPDKRLLRVRNSPYKLKISLKNPRVRGVGPDARFISGKLQVSWS